MTGDTTAATTKAMAEALRENQSILAEVMMVLVVCCCCGLVRLVTCSVTNGFGLVPAVLVGSLLTLELESKSREEMRYNTAGDWLDTWIDGSLTKRGSLSS